ncbi:hypothetical protein R1flu_017496 [Riccia fluitans]|uniref:Uncharacterized protein n=1 Tax=Riccia fluitans TaxID=41844 RepID=A0ABD1ZDF0_9MARC
MSEEERRVKSAPSATLLLWRPDPSSEAPRHLIDERRLFFILLFPKLALSPLLSCICPHNGRVGIRRDDGLDEIAAMACRQPCPLCDLFSFMLRVNEKEEGARARWNELDSRLSELIRWRISGARTRAVMEIVGLAVEAGAQIAQKLYQRPRSGGLTRWEKERKK